MTQQQRIGARMQALAERYRRGVNSGATPGQELAHMWAAAWTKWERASAKPLDADALTGWQGVCDHFENEFAQSGPAFSAAGDLSTLGPQQFTRFAGDLSTLPHRIGGDLSTLGPHEFAGTILDAPAYLVGSTLDLPAGPDLGDPAIADWARHSENNAMFAVVRCWNGLQANSWTSKQHDQAKNLINAMYNLSQTTDDGHQNAKRFVDIFNKVYAGATGGTYQYNA
jgi:hypothetical protein